jgi:hypothetical protein
MQEVQTVPAIQALAHAGCTLGSTCRSHFLHDNRTLGLRTVKGEVTVWEGGEPNEGVVKMRRRPLMRTWPSMSLLAAFFTWLGSTTFSMYGPIFSHSVSEL